MPPPLCHLSSASPRLTSHLPASILPDPFSLFRLVLVLWLYVLRRLVGEPLLILSSLFQARCRSLALIAGIHAVALQLLAKAWSSSPLSATRAEDPCENGARAFRRDQSQRHRFLGGAAVSASTLRVSCRRVILLSPRSTSMRRARLPPSRSAPGNDPTRHACCRKTSRHFSPSPTGCWSSGTRACTVRTGGVVEAHGGAGETFALGCMGINAVSQLVEVPVNSDDDAAWVEMLLG
eukprot:46386-Hanusia_phi.AAC.2